MDQQFNQSVAPWANGLSLDFLGDDFPFPTEPLDEQTLAVCCQVDGSGQVPGLPQLSALQSLASASSLAGPTATRAQSGKLVLPGGLAPPARPSSRGPLSSGSRGGVGGDASSGTDDDDRPETKSEPGDTPGPSGSNKRPRETNTTRNKAYREKARREKINDRFVELAKLIEPGKEPKVDKSTILSDAIKFVQQQTVENHQLRQLNKFLEERVSHFERERGQQLYQLSMMTQQSGAHMMAPQGMMMGLSGMGYGMAGPSISGAGLLPPQMLQPPLPPQQQMQRQQSQPMLNQQQQQQQQQHSDQQGQQCQLLSPQLVLSQQQQAQQQGQQQQPAVTPVQQQYTYLPVGKPAMGMLQNSALPLQNNPYWLPATTLDSAQDSLLRPPAA